MLNLFTNTQPLIHHPVGTQTLRLVRTVRKGSIALKHRASWNDCKGEVVILVPKTYSNKRLKKVLLLHQTWLEQSLKRLELRLHNAIALPDFSGKAGESFFFLGEEVTVVFESVEKKIPPLSQNGSIIHIHNKQCIVLLNHADNHVENHADNRKPYSQVCLSIEQFMACALQYYLPPKLDDYAQQIGVTYQNVTVKGYKARWGSCYPDGRLQFNWRLMQAPSWVIDYVIVHELCHLVHLNHSRDFWLLVQKHYARTDEAKQYLKQHGKLWIHFLQK